ncbi:hypothetical protein [Ferruginibacter sp.]
MKRRIFITAASIITVGLPVAYYIGKQKNQTNPLITPEFLLNFCDEKILNDIGAAYKLQVPEENEKKKLVDLILTDNKGLKIDASEWHNVKEHVSKKIHEEFADNKTIILKGWIITITEARQCALFSLK